MDNNKDSRKKLVQDFNALGWVELIFGAILIAGIFLVDDSVYQITLAMLGAVRLLVAFLMFRGKKYAENGDKTAHTFGIITGILLILGMSLISIILGILVLIDSSNYNKAISDNQNNS